MADYKLDYLFFHLKDNEFKLITKSKISMLRSPKRDPNRSSNRHKPFPYYAGYSEEFASDAINLFAKKSALILDPWNGAGTTSLVCKSLGINSIGIDLNPVMALVAKARIANDVDFDLAKLKLASFLLSFKRVVKDNSIDPLDSWMIKDFSSLIRYVTRRTFSQRKSNKLAGIDEISEICSSAEAWQCIIMLVIFRVVKIIAADARSSNPTWVKNSIDEEQKNKNIILPKVIILEFEKIRNLQSEKILNSSGLRSDVFCGSSESLIIDDESVDFILTSPPYCTRIDYAVSTILELAVLGLCKTEVDDNLRSKLIGTTSNRGSAIQANDDWGITCNSFLRNVFEHPSHGSRSYYYKNFCKYFSSIFNSIKEIFRVLKKGGIICVVLQGSSYKEFRIDLPKIFFEMAEKNGLSFLDKYNFSAQQYFVDINSKSKKYRDGVEISEEVLLLEKFK